MTRPLAHTYPAWEPPEDDPSAPPEEYREVWHGLMRIVRNPRRAKLLRRRGVPLWKQEATASTRRCWFWFTEVPL